LLILTRRINESIIIGDDITITVLNINGAHVRLGIVAPKSLPVDRQEIRVKKDAGPIDDNT